MLKAAFFYCNQFCQFTFDSQKGLEIDTGRIFIPFTEVELFEISRPENHEYEYSNEDTSYRTKDEIYSVVLQNLYKIQFIHSQYLKRGYKIKGKLVVKFT